MSRCADLLGPHGPFAASFSHYEPRTTQIEMAEAVECWVVDGIERAMNRFNR